MPEHSTVEPDIVYLYGDVVVPAKALEYKKDPATGTVIEKIPPRVRAFENELKADMEKELNDYDSFPTGKEVFISITHGLHSGREYRDCDLDNRAKTILDALKGPVYSDDNQVKMLWCEKLLVPDHETNYFRITITVLTQEKDEAISKLVRDVTVKR